MLTPEDTAPSKEQSDAFHIIEGAKLTNGRKAHAKLMILNPSLIQQGAFGVCGLTSVLFIVATHSPKRFAEMIRRRGRRDILSSSGCPPSLQMLIQTRRNLTPKWSSSPHSGLCVVPLAPHSPESKRFLIPMTRIRRSTKRMSIIVVDENQLKFSDSFEIQGWEIRWDTLP